MAAVWRGYRELRCSHPAGRSIDETVSEAARKMRDLGVGALPICGDDNRLKGMITGADDDIEEALATMSRAGVRRLPVIDGHDLVGMISQADIATSLPEDRAGALVAAISSGGSD